jgi:hypothetical protein
MPSGAAAFDFVRRRGVGITLEILVNFAAPFLIYHYAKGDWGEVNAMLASSAPPIVWSLAEFIRHRQIDALSLLVLAGIALSLLAMLGGGSVRFLQLREKLVTLLIGLVFLGSAALGRPIIYELARAQIRRRSADEAAAFEARRNEGIVRRVVMVMTLVWGAGLVADAALGAVLVVTLSPEAYLLVAPVLGYGTMGGLAFWTWWYSRSQGRKRDALLAAEAGQNRGTR